MARTKNTRKHNKGTKDETMTSFLDSSVKKQKKSTDKKEIEQKHTTVGPHCCEEHTKNESQMISIIRDLEDLHARLQKEFARSEHASDRTAGLLESFGTQLSEKMHENTKLKEENVKLKMEISKMKYDSFKISSSEYEAAMDSLLRQQGR